jgi:hypothetical protein
MDPPYADRRSYATTVDEVHRTIADDTFRGPGGMIMAKETPQEDDV